KPAVLNLVPHDARKQQNTNKKKNRNNCEPERKLVGKHLRTGTNGAQERILRIGCPTANHNPVNAQRGNREYKENPDVHVGNDHWHSEQRAAERHDRDSDNGRRHCQARRQPIIKRVGGARRKIFFQQQLEHVRNGLEKTGGPNAVRTQPILNKRADPPLGVNGVRNHEQDHPEKNRDLQQRRDDEKPIHGGYQFYRRGAVCASACRVIDSAGLAYARSKSERTLRRAAWTAIACSIASSSLGCVAGSSSIFKMCTPRSPILLRLNPANCGTVSLIRRKTSSIERSESPPPTAWSRSRKISQSSRALPGGRTARFSRCSRPLPLTIEPRFSANPHPGRSTVAFSVASFGKTFIMINTGSCASSSTGMPKCIVFSFRITSALILPLLTASAIASRFAPGSDFDPRMSRAPFVFGLRSSLSRMLSPGSRRGTMSIRCVSNDFANCNVSQSSSFVIRPEAMMAISEPENPFS